MKKGLIKHQEGRVLGRWRACSQMEKGMFLNGVGQWGEASVAVRFCDIGWLNVSVECCVFCSSVFSVRKRTHPPCEKERLRFAGEFYLSQSAQSSLSIFAHSFEPTEGLRHTEVTEAFQLRLAVTFCEIGWLNVSVGLCEICSSVFFCEK